MINIEFFKIAGLIAISAFILVLKNYIAALLFFLSLFIPVIFIKKKRMFFLRIVFFIPVAFSLFIAYFLFNTGKSPENNMIMFVLTMSKLLSVSLIFFYFSYFVSPSSLIKSMSFLGKKTALMLTISLALIPVILEEAKQIIMVQKSRGVSFNYFNISSFIVPLIHRILIRAESLSTSILIRHEDH